MTGLSDSIVRGLAEICLGGASFGCLYLVLACIAVLHFSWRRRLPGYRPTPVSVLKPLHGAEPDLSRHIASFCDQTYSAPVQLVCGVQDVGDCAIGTVVQLAAERPGQSIDLTIDGRQHGCNRKVSNLSNLLSRAQHDTILIADSDIVVGPEHLASVIAELQMPGVGAVTCLYHGIAGAGIWSRFAALAINSHFLPNVVTALSARLAQPCFGSTIALHRSTLARIGGFQNFADCLADDYSIGQAVRALGYEVAIPALSIGHVCFERSAGELLAREIRVARTIRSIDPLGHFGSIITHPFALALLGALLGGSEALGLALSLALLALACRAALCLSVEYAFGLPRQRLSALPVGDLLAFAVFVASYFGSSVMWRGAHYDVTADGTLLPDVRRSE